jgi:3-hydroxyisobutyrate dehydrogenase-like beta-hydroxyacid dehydrogenase
MTASIGFIGLGSMGLPMSRRLLERGYAVTIFDVRQDAFKTLMPLGGKPAASVREVADQCEIVFVCLPENAICREVTLGADGVVTGKTVRLLVNLGTHGSPLSQEMAAAFAKRSVVMIDAPVSGGIRGAAQGTLSVMVSGPRDAFGEIEPMLKCFGTSVLHLGEKVGVAQTMKLANNLISLGTFLLAAEAMTMGVKAGLDPEVMLDVINAGTGRSVVTTDKFPRHILTRTFAFGASTKVAAKDVRLAVAEAESLGVPVWVGDMVDQFFTFALTQGSGPKDFSTLVQLVEGWAGVEIKGSKAKS